MNTPDAPTITVTYEGDLSCVAVHAATGSELRTDAPKDNQGLGRTFSPTDTVAAAHATCAMTIMGIVARREGLPIEGMRAEVTKVMSTDAPRRIVALPMKLVVPGALSADQRQKLENAARTCPVSQSLHPDIETPIEFVFAGEGDGPD